MALFVFISGSELSTGAWGQCRGELALAGHESRALDLDGIPHGAGFEAIAEQLASRLGGPAPGAVVVGHSVAGLFLPLVGEMIGASREVFIASLVPQPGASFIEQMFEDQREVFDAGWVAQYGGRSAEAQRTVRQMLFHDCAVGAEEFYRGYAAGEALSLYEQRFPWEALPSRLREYIVCGLDRTILPEWQRYAAGRYLQVAPGELASGHCPQLSRPSELAALLLATVESRRIASPRHIPDAPFRPVSE